MYIVDKARSVNINSSLPPDSIYEEGTQVTIKCSFIARPSAQLSVWLHDGQNIHALTNQFETSSDFETTVSLTKKDNERAYFCRAENTEAGYVLFSEEISFQVICLYYFYFLCLCTIFSGS